MPVDSFAPRLSFFFNAHNDFFEEIAKYRAARKIWAEIMRDRFGAQDERSWKLRFHAQTAGCSLTWQQPYNNVVRTALQALAAVLGGTQSLHTNSLDEAYALPSEHAVTLALRTQQVIAYESGVHGRRPIRSAAAISSRALTLEMEKRARRLHPPHRRDGRHDSGHRARLPADAKSPTPATNISTTIETGERIIVGVNGFSRSDEAAHRTAADRRIGASSAKSEKLAQSAAPP